MASILNKAIVYYPFKDKRMNGLDKIIKRIQSKNPSLIQILQILTNYEEYVKSTQKEKIMTFYQFLLKKL